MDFAEAIDWVRRNEGLIRKTLGKYYMYSPYEEQDYLQDAYESAMVAVLKSQRKSISFESAFWQDFRKNISLVTPNTKSTRYGSNSVPSYLCSEDIDITPIAQQEQTPELDLEALFKKIRRHLTEREKTVFTLALGLTDKGTLTNYEIAECLKCSPTNVREAYNKAFERIKRLIREGVINPTTLRQSARIDANGGLHDEYRRCA
jgi:RNA polymerase sigma factor (sigma-70 family)